MNVSEKMYELGSRRSVIRDLSEYGKVRAAEIGAERVYDFSLGNPSIPAPECVNETIRQLTREMDSVSLHGYTSAQGDEETRSNLAGYLNHTYHTTFRADNFYLTMGAAASLCICFRALTKDPADEIVGIAPYFPEYSVFVESCGAKFVLLPPDRAHFQIDFDTLSEVVNEHTRSVLINSPNNPSGAVYTEETIRRLAALLTEKQKEYGHPIFIISDEPYREIVYDGVTVPYVTKYYANTLVCYSFSKSLSLPGERIGYVLVPDEADGSRELYAAVCGAGRSLGYVCAPSLMQKVIARCVGATGDISLYQKNRDLLCSALSDIGYRFFPPQGAFYLFMETPEEDDMAFAKRAKAMDLLLVPGSGFGCPGYVRVSYCVSYEMIERSIPAFRKLWESYRK